MGNPFRIVGHRGSPAYEVENTLPSFERAVSIDGANALEMDVCVTRDGELIVWHDADPDSLEARLRRLSLEPVVRCRPRRFRRPVCEMTLDEVRARLRYADKETGEPAPARVPLLGEVFEWARTRPRLGLVFLDVKVTPDCLHLVPRILTRLEELLAGARPRFELVLECAHREVLEALKRHGTRHGLALDVQPSPGLVLDPKSASAADVALEHGLAWACAQKPRQVTLFPFATHRRVVERDVGLFPRVCAFTINDADEMRQLLRLGVEAIQSDRPSLLRDVLAQTRDELAAEVQARAERAHGRAHDGAGRDVRGEVHAERHAG